MYLTRAGKRQLIAAVSVITAISCLLSLASIKGITADLPENEKYCHMSFELYPNGEQAEQFVSLDGLMPEGAVAQAVDVSDDYSGAAAYDITISTGMEEYQPGEENPVLVAITDPVITDSDGIQLWHIKDNGGREQINDITVTDGRLSFYATGFSVYEIVYDDDVIPVSGDYGWKVVKKTDKLLSLGGDGYYLSTASGYYFKDDLVHNVTNNSGRDGLKATSDAYTNSIPDEAVKYYFESADENSTDKYYIYCKKNNTDHYLKITAVKGQNMRGGLTLVTDKSDSTIFTLSETSDGFRCSGTADNKKYYLNRNTRNPGNGVIASYTDGNDKNVVILQCHYYAGAIKNDPYKLNGKSYGLMNQTTDTLGDSLMADADNNSLSLMTLLVRRESGSSTFYVSDNTDATIWTFHSVSEDLYSLSADVSGQTKYLKINDDGSLSLEDEPFSVKVTPHSTANDGRIMLSAGNNTIYFYNDENGTDSGFRAKNNILQTDQVWLNFVKISDLYKEDYVTFTANKVGVSDVDDGAQVIVYTRVWNDSKKTYEFYAIDRDGSLYPCYERGDNIMWVSNQINTLLWNFTEYHYDNGTPNYYYELYNPYSRKYLAPQIAGQTISDNKIGINMPGRRDGEYYSTILAWDDPYYSYAGLAAAAESGSKILKSVARAKADTFYFATMQPVTQTLTKVDTIDNNKYGISMKMIDFPDQPVTTSKDENQYQNHFLDDDGPGTDFSIPTQNLLTNHLENGYPRTTSNDKPLSELFRAPSKTAGDMCLHDVNHIFISSIYNSSGYFEYDSCQNFASLKGNNEGDFTVYKELGTMNSRGNSTDKHGQFMPYNDINAGVYSTKNPYNLNDVHGKALAETDPRKYEKLHLVGNPNDTKNTNWNFGMELEADFVQTPDGKDLWGHDIIFEFTGDDDFWFYVDDELVIDLGGIHTALAGSVNFSTGDVIVNGEKKTLRQIFESNYISRNPDASEAEISGYLNYYFEGSENIFKDYSRHTMKMFYMERGKGASNLHMRFNLSYVTPGHVILTKSVTGTQDLDFDLVEYPYQIWYKDEEYGEEKLLTNTDQLVSVTYQNSTQKVDYIESYTPPNSNNPYSSVYCLNPNKSAEIHFPANTIEYRIIECGINHEVYDHVYVNGTAITGQSIGNTNRNYFDSGWLRVKDRPTVVYENHVDPSGLRTLSIQKNLFDEADQPVNAQQDPTTFSFRLYLTNGVVDDLELANMYRYRVRDPEGYLCRWDAEVQKFVSTSLSDTSAMSGDQKDAVTFETSMNGSISKIPAGYTVDVPFLPVGTEFKVEERTNEIPLGYTWKSYEREYGSYKTEDGDTLNSGWVRANESPKMYVNNRRGWGLEANKVWSDKYYTSDHDPIYTAVYVKKGENSELLEGTVRQIVYPDTYVRYYFQELLENTEFSDYEIMEVELADPVVGENGVVEHYSNIAPRYLISLGAVPKSKRAQQTFSYFIEYERGEPVSTAPGYSDENGNIRTDTITNTRGGGIAIKLFDVKCFEQAIPDDSLANGVFELRCSDTMVGKFTSNSYGIINLLYDFNINAEYTLRQIQSPSGYIGLDEDVKFTVADDNSINISGPEGKWYKLRIPESNDQMIAYLNIFNKSYSFKAVKKQDSSYHPLSGAHFALYRSVPGVTGLIKDYEPMPGYEDLVSDDNGIIPKISQNLEPDKYYLEETQPPEGYIRLSNDIVFSIDKLGEMKLLSDGDGIVLDEHDNSDINKTFVLKIPNKPDNKDFYFDIEKIIFVDKNVHQSDTEQRFVFMVERLEKNGDSETAAERFYLTLNCDKEMTYKSDSSIELQDIKLNYGNEEKPYDYSLYTDGNDKEQFDAKSCKVTKFYYKKDRKTKTRYKYPAALWNGRQTVHVKKDGRYRITEISSWSSTDYDFWTGSNVLKTPGEKTTSAGEPDGSVIINVDAKNADGGAKSQSRITASFTSSETEFAYNSSQAYAVNTIDRS